MRMHASFHMGDSEHFKWGYLSSSWIVTEQRGYAQGYADFSH